MERRKATQENPDLTIRESLMVKTANTHALSLKKEKISTD